MDAKLTYLSFLSFAACLASSCASDTPDIGDVGNGAELTFAVGDLSRGSVTTEFNEFTVYGDTKATDKDTAPAVVLFSSTNVKYADGLWSYAGTQYWYPDREHSFVAVSPSSVLAAGSPRYSDSQLSFTYTVPTTANRINRYTDVADIIVATHRRLYVAPPTPIVTTDKSVVTLQFGHLLSLINFSLELTGPSARSEECLKIRKLEMSGFGTSATINITPAPRLDNSQTNDSEIGVVTAKGNGSLEINFAEPIEVTNGAAAIKMFDDNDAIIMLPQTFVADTDAKISITYSVNDEENTTTVSAPLSGLTWESGKSYNYKIKLELPEPKEANMVISNAIIKPWELIDDHDEVEAK